MSAQSELKKFQRSLDENEEEKRRYVDAELQSEEDDSNSEEEEAIKIVAPKKSRKRSPIDTMLMEQLISQQKEYLKAQKTICKLRTEIDTEEVKTRYIKLDLNNAQVKIAELTELEKNYRRKYHQEYTTNKILIMLIISYFIWRVFLLF
jgi:hypothetical protein